MGGVVPKRYTGCLCGLNRGLVVIVPAGLQGAALRADTEISLEETIYALDTVSIVEEHWGYLDMNLMVLRMIEANQIRLSEPEGKTNERRTHPRSEPSTGNGMHLREMLSMKPESKRDRSRGALASTWERCHQDVRQNAEGAVAQRR